MTNCNRRHGARWILQGIKSNLLHTKQNPNMLLSAAEKNLLAGIAGVIERMLYKDEFWGESYKDAIKEQRHE